MPNEAVTAALFGSTTAVAWGISDFLAAKASRSVGPIVAAFVVNALAALMYIAFFLIFLDTRRAFTSSGLIYGALGGVAVLLGAFLFFRALDIGPVSLVSPVSATYPLVTTLLAVTVFGARLTWVQLVGILMTVVGVMVATEIVGGGGHGLQQPLGRGPLLALGAAGVWGLGYSFLAQAAERMGWQLATLVQLTFTLILLAILVPFSQGREHVSSERLRPLFGDRLIVSASLVQLVGAIALNVGLTAGIGQGAIVTTVSATYPLLTIVLALLHFREKVRPMALVGAIVAVSGIVVLSTG